MTTFLLGLALFLVLNLAAGLVRVARGPTPADRMVAAQLFGTTGVGILLVLAEAGGVAALLDVALVFALLAVVVSVAFVKRGWVRRVRPARARPRRPASGPGSGAGESGPARPAGPP